MARSVSAPASTKDMVLGPAGWDRVLADLQRSIEVVRLILLRRG